MFTWRLGFPGWRLAARAGVPLTILVTAFHDAEAGVYVATSPQVKGLNVEHETLDGLKAEVEAALLVLLDLDYQPLRERPHMQIQIEDCHSAA